MVHSILVTIRNGIVYHAKNVSHGPKDNGSALCCWATSPTLAANLNHDDGDVHQDDIFLMNHVENISHLNFRHLQNWDFHHQLKNIFHLKGILHLNFRYLQDWDFHLRMQYRLHRLQYRLQYHRTHHQRQRHHLNQHQASHSPEPMTSSA